MNQNRGKPGELSLKEFDGAKVMKGVQYLGPGIVRNDHNFKEFEHAVEMTGTF